MGKSWQLDKRFVGVVVTLAMMAAGGVARFVTVENRIEAQQAEIVQLKADTKADRAGTVAIIERLAKVETLLQVLIDRVPSKRKLDE